MNLLSQQQTSGKLSSVSSTIKKSVRRDRIEALFSVFANGEEKIGPDGLESMCEQLGISPDNVTSLFKSLLSCATGVVSSSGLEM